MIKKIKHFDEDGNEFKNTADQGFIKNTIKKYIPDMANETLNRRTSTIKGWIQ